MARENPSEAFHSSRATALGFFGERLAHLSVLTSHPPIQSALNLRAQCKFVQIVGLRGAGNESLFGERLVV